MVKPMVKIMLTRVFLRWKLCNGPQKKEYREWVKTTRSTWNYEVIIDGTLMNVSKHDWKFDNIVPMDMNTETS